MLEFEFEDVREETCKTEIRPMRASGDYETAKFRRGCLHVRSGESASCASGIRMNRKCSGPRDMTTTRPHRV